MKRAIALLLSIFLVSCSSIGEQPESGGLSTEILHPSKVQKIGWNLGYQPTSLDPQMSDDVYAQQVIGQLYTGLFRYNGIILVRSLCDTYEVSQDRLKYTFKLRKSYWSDGTPLTAHDFEYAWKRVLRRGKSSVNGHYFINIAGYNDVVYHHAPIEAFKVGAVDDDTLVVELESADENFLKKLTLPPFMPVKKELVSSNRFWYHDVKKAASNGPFYLYEYNEGNSYVLHRNPYYYHANNVKLDSIIVEMIDDEDAKYTAFLNNQLQIVEEVIPSKVDNLRTVRQELYSFNDIATTFIIVNSRRGLLKEKAIRRTFLNAIDRQAVVEQALELGEVPTTGVVPYGVGANTTDFRHYAGDHGIDINNAYVDKGLPDGILKDKADPLRMIVHAGTRRSQVTKYIVSMWRKLLDVNVDVVFLDWKDYNIALKTGHYDFAFVEWRFPLKDVLLILSSFKSGRGYFDWEDEVFKKLLTLAAKEKGSTQLNTLERAENNLVEQAMVIPLYHSKEKTLINKKLMNWEKTPLGYWDFSQAWLVQ